MNKIVGNKDIKYIIADIPPTIAFSIRSSSLFEKIYPNKAKKAIIKIAIVITFSININNIVYIE